MGMIAGDRSLSVWDSEEEDEVKKTDGVGQTACGGCLDESQMSRLQGFTPALGLSDAPPKEKTKAKIVAWKVLKSCDSLCEGGREAAGRRRWSDGGAGSLFAPAGPLAAPSAWAFAFAFALSLA